MGYDADKQCRTGREERIMGKKRILAVDDEVHILELIKYNLESAGYEVDTAENGEDAVRMAKGKPYSLVLLDLMLPGMDGMEVCGVLRKDPQTRQIPIIMLTAKSEEADKVKGLKTGSDDYITKPFSVKELEARIDAVLRRSGETELEAAIEAHGVVIDPVKHEVRVAGNPVETTLKEYELLKLLILNKGKVLTRDIILDKVWGYEYFGDTRTVDVHIRHLRKKLDDKGEMIETVRGVGYKMR